MSHDDRPTSEELLVIDELHTKYLELHNLDVKRLVVTRRILGHWYIELSYENTDAVVSKAVPYDVDISAEDCNKYPLGLALFYNEIVPLCKLHVFRYDGSGPIDVATGSIRVF